MIVPCIACGKELNLSSRSQPHCINDVCNLAYGVHMARTNVAKVGDCEVWQGSYANNGARKTPIVRVVTDRAKNHRVDWRVLSLREDDPSHARKRVYDNTCGTHGCVLLAHNDLRVWVEVEKKRVLQGKLPAQPLLDLVDRMGVVLPRSTRERLLVARRRGWIRVGAVDEICIDYLKTHPANVYGEDFFVA